MTFYIDADNCPSLVLNFTAQYCKQKKIRLNVVANHDVKIKNAEYTMTICEEKKDAADDYIFEHAQDNDIVVTKDIFLAERLVNKNITTLNDRGYIFEKSNIKYRIQDSALNLQLSSLGFGGKKEKNYSNEMLEKYIKSVEKIMRTINPESL